MRNPMDIVWTLVWLIGGVLLVFVGVVFAVGALLPRDHVVSGATIVARPPAAVWPMIRDASKAGSWRTSLIKVDGLEGPQGAPSKWTEHYKGQSIPLVVEESVERRTLVTRIADDSMPFGGTWTIELNEAAGGTEVRVTERGFVKPPPFRFIAKFFMGHDATLKSYLEELRVACESKPS
jgi:Polyketide cyclase / dehydrase and lipid transport